MKRFFCLAILTAFATPALALNNRSAVSVNGIDSNPCTTASPCRSFGAAIAQTSPGGEVVAIDTAGYGPFTVTAEMTISGAPGIHAAITGTSGFTIFVNAGASDVVEIRNLTLIGTGLGNGIEAAMQLDLRVMHCILTGFANGIVAAAGRLLVDHTVVADGGTAIQVTNPTVHVEGVIIDSVIDHCSAGVDFENFASGVVANTTIVGISGFAVYAESIQPSGSTPARAVVQGCNFAFVGGGILVGTGGSAGNTAIVYINDTTISHTATGVFINGTGQVKTYGNNRFPEVTSVGALSSIALQ